MTPQEQFSKLIDERVRYHKQLEETTRQLTSAQNAAERARLESEVARLRQILEKSTVETKRAADQLVNPPGSRLPWWKRIATLFSRPKRPDLTTLRNPLLRQLSATCELSPPATEAQLAATETSCGVSLPQPLRELLLESNGIFSSYGAKLVWSVAEMDEHNKHFWNDESLRTTAFYESFNNFFFIGDDACGDQFAFALEADRRIHKPTIYRWDHETDARSVFAKDLSEFLRKAEHEEGL